MSPTTRVLMVDDEPNVLAGYRRTIGRKLDLVTANGGKEGLEILDKQPPFAVVITDMRMPEMDGLEFLKKARAKHPKSVYVMLTGNADQQTAIDAINQGQIYRFLNKPCDPEILEHTIRVCKTQYDLIHAEAELLNNTLSGIIKLLIEAMVISDPAAADTVRHVREGVHSICEGLGITNEWRYPLAGSLFLIGGITVPRSSPEEIFSEEYIAACAKSGAKLLRHISRFDEVAQIILHQRVPLMLPKDISHATEETRVAIGSQILRFAYDWHKAAHELHGDRYLALQRVESGGRHDARLLDAAHKGLNVQAGVASKPREKQLVKLSVRDLRPGMVTEHDIKVSDETLLVAKGQVLSQLMIDRLRGYAKAGLIGDTHDVWVEDHEMLPESGEGAPGRDAA